MEKEIEKIKQEYEEKQRKKKAKKKSKDDDKDKKKDDEDDDKAERERDEKVSPSLFLTSTMIASFLRAESGVLQIKAVQSGTNATDKPEDIPRIYALHK